MAHDTEASERNYQAMVGLLGDILPVETRDRAVAVKLAVYCGGSSLERSF